MKKNLALITIAAILALTGCTTVNTTPDKIARAEQVAYSVALAGVTADLIANPTHRVWVEASAASLKESLAAGTLNAGALARIVSTLPIKSEQLRVVNGALLVWDIADSLWGNTQSDAAIKAVASGLLRGAETALAASPSLRSARAGVLSAEPKPVVPKPSKSNTRTI